MVYYALRVLILYHHQIGHTILHSNLTHTNFDSSFFSSCQPGFFTSACVCVIYRYQIYISNNPLNPLKLAACATRELEWVFNICVSLSLHSSSNPNRKPVLLDWIELTYGMLYRCFLTTYQLRYLSVGPLENFPVFFLLSLWVITNNKSPYEFELEKPPGGQCSTYRCCAITT